MNTTKRNLLSVNLFFFITFCIYFILSWILSEIFGIYAVIITGFLALFLFPFLYCKNKSYNIKEIFSLKLLSLKSLILIIIGSVITLFLSQLAAALGTLLYDLIGKKPMPQIKLESDIMKIIFQFLLTGLFVPILEETFFRGFLLGIYRKLNVKHAAIITGLLFGLFHLQFHIIVGTIIAGIIWAYFTEYTGSILSSIIPHILFNSTTLWLMYNQDKIKKMSGNESYKLNVGSLIFLILFSISIIFILYLIIIKLKKINQNNKITNEPVIINEEVNKSINSENFDMPVTPWLPVYIFAFVVLIFSGLLIFN